jgi:hypothetical protein
MGLPNVCLFSGQWMKTQVLSIGHGRCPLGAGEPLPLLCLGILGNIVVGGEEGVQLPG